MQTFLSIPKTQKCQILSCDTLVANERYYFTNKIIFQHVARMGEKKIVYRCLVGKPEGKRPLENPGVDGRIVLRWKFRKWDEGPLTASIWVRLGTGSGHL
jgi:hypothetical protein